jgi:hemoglobin
MKRPLCSLALALAVLSVASDASGQATKSLYDRLGGKAAIVAVVDDFVANCAADARINKFFAATAADKNRLATFKNNLVDQICEASGGPCKYKGKDMKAAQHRDGHQQRRF